DDVPREALTAKKWAGVGESAVAYLVVDKPLDDEWFRFPRGGAWLYKERRDHTDLRPTQHMYEVQVPNKTAHVFQHPGTQAFDRSLPRAGLWLTTVTRVYDRTTRVWSTTHPLVERSLASLEQLTRAERDIGERLRTWLRRRAREAARRQRLKAGQPI